MVRLAEPGSAQVRVRVRVGVRVRTQHRSGFGLVSNLGNLIVGPSYP